MEEGKKVFPYFWSSHFGDGCAEEARVAFDLCVSAEPDDLDCYPDSIIDFSTEPFSTCTSEKFTKSKLMSSANN